MSMNSGILRRTLLSSTSTTFARSSRTAVPLNRFTPIPRPSTTSFYSAPASFFSTSSFKMGVHNLEAKSDWDTALGEKEKLIVVDCFATWCGPCKAIAPQVVKFSDEYPDAKFYKIDVDQLSEVAAELGIRAMPTFLLFKNGERVSEVVGANPKALEAAIKSNM